MQWLNAVPAIVVAGTVLMGPGLFLGWWLRARGFALMALAPVLSVALIAVAALLAPFLALQWSVVPVLGLTLLASAAAFAVARWGSRNPGPFKAERHFDSRFSFAALATLLAGGIIAARLIYAFGSPANISQTFDNIFHLNAVQYILETRQASSLTVGAMTGIPFYPAAWHDIVSLTVQLSGVGIPVAANVVNLVIGALAWPMACIYLCQQVLGQSRLAAVLAGVMSAAFGAFPLMMVDFGVLYPNLLSISLLPALLALGSQLLKLSVVQDFVPPSRYLAAVIAAAGVALAHPSTFMACLAFMAPAVLLAFVSAWKRWRSSWPQNSREAIGYSSGLAGAGIAALVMWQAIRPAAETAFWPPFQSPLGALWELASNSAMNRPPAIAASVFVAVGVWALIRQRERWWVLGMLAVACGLFLVSSSFRPGRIRDFLTAIWYNDSYRLAALIPAVAVPLAAVGAVWLIRRVQRKLVPGRAPAGVSSASSPVAWPAKQGLPSAALVVAVALATQLGGIQHATETARGNYELRQDSKLVTSDEMAVLQDMKVLVPPDAVVAANPRNGGALAYALAGRRTIELHVLTSNATPEDRTILNSLREASTDPVVCPAVRALGVEYVLDFGSQEVNDGSGTAPGLENLDANLATVLSQHGDAKLLKFEGCK